MNTRALCCDMKSDAICSQTLMTGSSSLLNTERLAGKAVVLFGSSPVRTRIGCALTWARHVNSLLNYKYQ